MNEEQGNDLQIDSCKQDTNIRYMTAVHPVILSLAETSSFLFKLEETTGKLVFKYSEIPTGRPKCKKPEEVRLASRSALRVASCSADTVGPAASMSASSTLFSCRG